MFTMYSASVVKQAKNMRKAGSTLRRIRACLKRRATHAPAVSTIQRWLRNTPKADRPSKPKSKAAEATRRSSSCPRCRSASTERHGHRRTRGSGRTQRHRCRDCGHTYSLPRQFGRTKYGAHVVVESLILRARGRSLGDTQRAIGWRTGFHVAKPTIRAWSKRFGQDGLPPVARAGDPIQTRLLYHRQTYVYQLHERKANELAPRLLAGYLWSILRGKLPTDIFMEGSRCSQLTVPREINCLATPNPIVGMARMALLRSKSSYDRHRCVQQFLLACDVKTIACEVPVFLRNHEISKTRLHRKGTLSGHIDVLQVRDGKIHIWDYKPDARKAKKAAQQVFLYAVALSERTGIPLDQFVCGYFDDADAYTFLPRQVFYNSLRDYRFLPMRKRKRAFRKLCSLDNLWAAWEELKKRRGALGIDKMTVDQFANNVQWKLLQLHVMLRDKKYLPAPVVRRFVPKPNGKLRPLSAYCLRDRIVQLATKNVIEAFFEGKFRDCNFGFRPGRNAHQAVKRLLSYYRRGANVFLKLDLKEYYDTIDTAILLRLVGDEIPDPDFLDLLRKSLRLVVSTKGTLDVQSLGISQGSIVSPLLANIYLHELDGYMEDAGYLMIRYADDLVVACLTEEEAQGALARITTYLREHRKVAINNEKTSIQKDRVELLGFSIAPDSVRPSAKGTSKLKERISGACASSSSSSSGGGGGSDREELLAQLNTILRQWANYYVRDYTDAAVWEELDAWVRDTARLTPEEQAKLLSLAEMRNRFARNDVRLVG
ncbi:MAG: reverse transcriptase domain-containing protein [Pseudomonadota bacterium]